MRTVGACLLVLATLASSPANAWAGPDGHLGFLYRGFMDNPTFEYSTPASESLWLQRARQIGSSAVRLDVTWAWIAPRRRPRRFDAADPAAPGYDFTELDAAVRAAAAADQTILLTVTVAPAWAQGPHRPSFAPPGTWEPNARDYAQFARALALRYSGHFPDPLNPGRMLPRVRYFQAWNEPNLPYYLNPQWIRTRGGRIVAASPDVYRGLLNAFYAAVKSVQPGAYVLAAGTAPFGDAPGIDRMHPLTFLERLLCLNERLRALPCPQRAHFDALDDHPYSPSPTSHALVAGDVELADQDQIWKILHAAARNRSVLPTGAKALWVTELAWSTHPRGVGGDFPVSEAVQGRYLVEGLYELWLQDVSRVFWYQIRDPPNPSNPLALDGGLYSYGGAPKPSAAEYRFPFLARPMPGGLTVLWGIAPASGTVSIQRRRPSGWQTVRRLRTTASGLFYIRVRLPRHLVLRALAAGDTSPPWSE